MLLRDARRYPRSLRVGHSCARTGPALRSSASVSVWDGPSGWGG